MLAADASFLATRQHPAVNFAKVSRQTDGSAVLELLTTELNSLVAPIHPKQMPVLLYKYDEVTWLRAPIEAAMQLVAP